MKTSTISMIVLAAAGPALAQPFAITFSTIDGGGVTAAAAGAYTLGGTMGQPDAGVLTAAPYQCQGGFWNTGAVALPCYADCDGVGGLTANDFQCFLNAFVAASSVANCDGVGGLTANDFQCFLDKFVAGCS